MLPARRLLLFLPIAFLLSFLFSACSYEKEDDHWIPNERLLPDSATFRATHHYHRGFNFAITDSLRMDSRAPFEPRLSLTADTSVMLRRGDIVMVEEVRYDTTATPREYRIRLTALHNSERGEDLRVATGWVGEKELLHAAVPDHPISKFIHGFSSRRAKIAMLCLSLFALLIIIQALRHHRLRLVHFNDIGSVYPTLLTILVSGTAVLYRSLQDLAPDTWTEYYFHPTLNPLSPSLPSILALFVVAIWLLAVGIIAVVDELRRRIDVTDAATYFSGLCAVCVFLYILFTLILPAILVIPFLFAYWAFALIRYYRKGRGPAYLCGKCGCPMPRLGRCPQCGADNR